MHIFGTRMLRIELPGKRKRRRPKRKFMDAVRVAKAMVEGTEEDAEHRTEMEMENPLWRPLMGKPKKKKTRKKMSDEL